MRRLNEAVGSMVVWDLELELVSQRAPLAMVSQRAPLAMDSSIQIERPHDRLRSGQRKREASRLIWILNSVIFATQHVRM